MKPKEPVHFITNQQKLLSDVVNKILPYSQKLYFLAGYFYFSGFEEIYKNIKDKELKILVGLNIETELSNKICEYDCIQNTGITRSQIKDYYNKSLISLFNDTDYFDTPERQAAFRIFLEKIHNGTLEIRKTVQPNHAKLYIFENKSDFSQGGEYPGTIITGSSNLSRSGFRDRFEINVLSREPGHYAEAYSIFEKLWNESVPIVDKSNITEFITNVIEKIWIDKLPAPYLMYLRVLDEYFPQYNKNYLHMPSEITRGRYFNLKYQEDAIKKAIDIIQKHNGVIIADVVGLGKSIIASAVAHNLNLKTIIITPPHLVSQWDDYRYEFQYNTKIYTSGKIEDALKENDIDEEKLIIIDEAHKYRNELTDNYANLHKLCQRNKVILLTATPFNNRPQDVFAMVRLFQITARSTIQTVDNLSYQFKKLIEEYATIKKLQRIGKESAAAIELRINKVAGAMRNILYPLVIRRSRLDLKAIKEYDDDLKKQKIEFSQVNDPKILDYELGDLTKLYEETLEIFAPDDSRKGGFIGARYMPTSYIKPEFLDKIAAEMKIDKNLLLQTQVNLAEFMKRLLVRRFESSIYSFQSTLDSIINSSNTILKWYDKFGKVPVYKKGKLPDIDELAESIGEDMEEALKEITLVKELMEYKDKGLILIDKKELQDSFVDTVKADIAILEKVKKMWFANGMPVDPKLKSFAGHISEKLKDDPRRKIVVFTEFADTAQYLFDNLKDKLNIFKYSAGDASTANKKIIAENFDAGNKTQKNDYDILIATDAISEGFNLHRAGIIFNYDIPYNPTRVIQRVGRINRINKKVFDELFIYNFFPTPTGERETRIKQISTLKIAMVHALFGEDTKVLTKDEELQSHFAKQFRDTLNRHEQLSPEAKYENFIRQLRVSNPDIIEKAAQISKRSRIKRTAKKDKSGVIVFGKKGGEFVFKYAGTNKTVVPLGVADALKLFEAAAEEPAEKVDKNYEEIYGKIREKLFSKRTEVALNRGKRDTIAKAEALKEKLPAKKDYIEDLLYVLKELDALPEIYAKSIRAISLEQLEKEFSDFQDEVPHKYLLAIMDRERKIEEGKETLILSEELV